MFESRVHTVRFVWSYQLLVLALFFSKKSFIFLGQDERFYRKLTAACQTKAKRKKSIGMTGIKSTIGLKKAYASGNLTKKKLLE
jgi:hypothetical protein